MPKWTKRKPYKQKTEFSRRKQAFFRSFNKCHKHVKSSGSQEFKSISKNKSIRSVYQNIGNSLCATRIFTLNSKTAYNTISIMFPWNLDHGQKKLAFTIWMMAGFNSRHRQRKNQFTGFVAVQNERLSILVTLRQLLVIRNKLDTFDISLRFKDRSRDLQKT